MTSWHKKGINPAMNNKESDSVSNQEKNTRQQTSNVSLRMDLGLAKAVLLSKSRLSKVY